MGIPAAKHSFEISLPLFFSRRSQISGRFRALTLGREPLPYFRHRQVSRARHQSVARGYDVDKSNHGLPRATRRNRMLSYLKVRWAAPKAEGSQA